MSMPIRTVVADDELLGRERIRQLLEDHVDVEIVAECEDGLEAVRAVEKFAPDLLFLDVEMPELDGVGVLNALGPERVPEVIFTTAHAEYMERAFEVHAIDYLRKPFREARFREALHHAKRRILAKRAVSARGEMQSPDGASDTSAVGGGIRLKIPEKNGGVRLVPAADVFCLEADADYVQVHTRKETFSWRATLARASEALDPATFLRVHRSFVVNTRRVTRAIPMGKGEFMLELENGKKVGTGRSYRDAVEAFVKG